MTKSNMWKRLLLLIKLYLIIPLFSFAQNTNTIWYFSVNSGIDFNNLTNPVAITSPIGLYNQGTVGTICDSIGNLLLYAESTTIFNQDSSLKVYNRFNTIINNGDSLKGSTQSFAGIQFIPYPNRDGFYFMISLTRSSYSPGQRDTAYYTLIDNHARSDSGEVFSKNNILFPNVAEMFAITKHANGRDWWVVMKAVDTDSIYYKALITPDSIYRTSQITPTRRRIYAPFGQMVFSKDGSKLVQSMTTSYSLYVFDFDRCTGALSNLIDLSSVDTINPPPPADYRMGCSISPNNRFVYASSYDYSVKKTYQYDLFNSNPYYFRRLINSVEDTGYFFTMTVGLHSMGPDDKIYIAKGRGPGYNNFYTNHLDVINYPDRLGAGCAYTQCGFDLSPNYSCVLLPKYPNYNLGPLIGSICDTIYNGMESLAEKVGFQVYPSPNSTGIFRYKLPEGKKIEKLMVQDCLGRVVMNVSNDAETFQLNGQGMYFVTATLNDGRRLCRKVLVQE